MRALTLAWLLGLAVFAAWEAPGLVTFPLLVGGLAIAAIPLWISDLAGAWFARRKAIPRAAWAVLATLAAVAVPVWGAWLCFRVSLIGPGLALSVGAAVLGLAAAWSVHRLLSPTFRLTFLLALVQLQACFAEAHLSEETLVAVREGTEWLHLGIFYGMWGASLLLALGWMMRVAEVAGGRTEGRRGGAAGVALRGATGMAGLGLLVADRQFFPGLYPGFHEWMMFVGLGSVSVLLVWPLRWLFERFHPRIAWTVPAMVILVAAPCAWLMASPHAADPFIRASLEQSHAAPLALRFREGAPLGEGFERQDLPILDYRNHHDFAHDLPRHNILLVTVDGLRGDYVGPAATHAGHTPRLNRIIEESAWFPRAYSIGPRTAITMSGILLSRYSANIEWNLFIWHKSSIHDPREMDEPTRKKIGNKWIYTTMPTFPERGTLAQRLQAAGYFTIGVPYIRDDAFFEPGLGFERGFDVYRALGEIRGKTTSEKVVRSALTELERVPAGRPWFLWVHLFDPHEGRARREVYGEKVEAADLAIGGLIDALEDRGTWDDTLFVLLADHGHAMGEHGQRFHGTSLYDEQVRVPMIVRLPGTPPMVLGEPSSVIDGTATILSLARADMTGTDGVNLLPYLISGDYPRGRPVFVELHRYWGRTGAPSHDGKGVVLGDHKLIYNRKDQWVKLFNLADDPAEEVNLVQEEPLVARRLLEVLLSWVNPRERANPLPR